MSSSHIHRGCQRPPPPSCGRRIFSLFLLDCLARAAVIQPYRLRIHPRSLPPLPPPPCRARSASSSSPPRLEIVNTQKTLERTFNDITEYNRCGVARTLVSPLARRRRGGGCRETRDAREEVFLDYWAIILKTTRRGASRSVSFRGGRDRSKHTRSWKTLGCANRRLPLFLHAACRTIHGVVDLSRCAFPIDESGQAKQCPRFYYFIYLYYGRRQLMSSGFEENWIGVFSVSCRTQGAKINKNYVAKLNLLINSSHIFDDIIREIIKK